MKRRAAGYRPRYVSMPTVIIAVGWLALWLLWPQVPRTQARPAAMSVTRVSYVRCAENPYARPSPMHDWPAAGLEGDSVNVAPWFASRPARLLDKDGWTSAAKEPVLGDRHIGELAGCTLKEFKPVWNDVPVFGSTRSPQMNLNIEAGTALAQAGFELPALPSELTKFGKPWMVSVFVEVGVNGRVTNAFLDKGCEDPRINALVVKEMYKGVVSAAGTPCADRVKINFGQD